MRYARRPELIWHYTTGTKMPSIQAEGVIRTSPHVFPSEREAVWFSSNPVWERTAAKAMCDPWTGVVVTLTTMDEHIEYCGGLYRICVAPEVAPHDWNAFRRLSGISPKYANGLREIGYRWGARISEWFVSFEPVPRSQWFGIEVWEQEAWKPFLPEHTQGALAA